jgi:NarL family two-component system response regulator LiaR
MNTPVPYPTHVPERTAEAKPVHTPAWKDSTLRWNDRPNPSWATDRAQQSLRVFVVDDHAVFRMGVCDVLQRERAMQCVGEAADGSEAVYLAPALMPDVVLMDMNMPRMDGVAALQALRPLLPDTRFVMMACALDAAQARRAIDAGALSFMLKSVSPQELVTVIQAAHRGQRVVASEVMDLLMARDQPGAVGADLTQRERKLLALMACGLPNREISAQLSIAMPTVKFHVTNILSKLNADNRTSAVLAALRHHLVALD